MTELLEKAVEAARQLRREARDDIARVILSLAGQEEEPEPIDPDHLSAVLEGLAQAERGEFAGEAEVEAAFRRFR